MGFLNNFGAALSSMLATSHVWLFKLIFKLIKSTINKNKALQLYCHISSAHCLCVTVG